MKLTPAMKQYMDIKAQHPDALLLFRMGDFYETFYDDAHTVAQVLDITLTSRGKDETKAPLAGIPYHALDKYLGQLVQAGHTVAICEQLEDPKQAKGVVKRGVTRIITPGTVVDQQMLSAKQANYIGAFFGDETIGYAFCDISTGQVRVGECVPEDVAAVLNKMQPVEVLHTTETKQHLVGFGAALKQRAVHEFSRLDKVDTLVQHHQLLEQFEYAQYALSGLLRYIVAYKHNIDHITTVHVDNKQPFMYLDGQTLHNLEILHSQSRTHNFSLLKTLDTTKTPMGGRLLKEWLTQPLYDKDAIMYRHASVKELLKSFTPLQEQLSLIADIERICAKITNDMVNPRELIQLATSLQHCSFSQKFNSRLLAETLSLPKVREVMQVIATTLKDEPAVTVREGNMIREGFNKELDELRSLSKDSKDVLAQIQVREQQSTNIPTLKVRYNKVFGYFIEVTSRFADKVPDHYQRKQTLANAERFVTDELNALEHKILTAQEKVHTKEYGFFIALVDKLKEHIPTLLDVARRIATLDVLVCFAYNTYTYDYCIPEFGSTFVLKESRHPVVERHASSFIANSCTFAQDKQLHMITGPNMAGKSTYMRQIALCALLAQCGCGVPATSFQCTLIDRIFTRIGARDDLATGQSTFMVEMTETATILQQATKHSLVILDEIGRGTSTYDGVAIAYAVAEDLRSRIQCKTLFATHYHVLTTMDQKGGVQNFNVAVAHDQQKMIFLHKVVEGSTDKSYGIHVASLAGVPDHVVSHALKVQERLMSADTMAQDMKLNTKKKKFPEQTTLFDL